MRPLPLLALAALAFLLPTVLSGQEEPSTDDSAAYRFLEAKVLLGEGRYREALEGLRAVVATEPDDPYLRLELGRLAGRLGRAEVAAREADAALRLAPDDPDVLYGAGEIYQALASREPGFAARAEETLDKLLAVDPGDVRALMGLGRLLQQQGRLQEAEEYFRRLAAQRPGERTSTFLLQVLLEQGENEAAREVLREALARAPEALEMRFGLADLLAEDDQVEAALEVLLQTPIAQANEPELVRRVAGLLLRSGRRDEAVARLESALAENPQADRLQLFLALLLADRGEADRARAILEERLAAEPGDVDATEALIRLLARVGEAGEARAVAAGAIDRLRPEDPETAGQLARGLVESLARTGHWSAIPEAAALVPEEAPESVRTEVLELELEALAREGRHGDALDRLDRSPLEGPSLDAVRAELLWRTGQERKAERILGDLRNREPHLAAQVYQSLERYEEAVPLWEEAVAAEAGAPQPRFSLAAAYERVGRIEDAVTGFRELIDEYPDFHLALNYLGYMWAEQGENLEEAQRLIERALELDPDNAAYADSLGWVYYQRGEYRKALAQIRRAADVLPDDGTVQEHLGDVHLALGNLDEAREAYERALSLGEDGRERELERKLREAERMLRGQEP